MTQDQTTVIGLIIQGLGVLATIGVALLAVFGQTVRRWFFRPKLSVEVGDEAPYVQIEEMDTDSSSDNPSKFAEARVRVRNTGKDIAISCKAVVDSVYQQRPKSSDLYNSDTFIPRPLTWDNGDETVDLLPKVPSYISVLRIVDKTLAEMSSPRTSGPEEGVSLYLLIGRESRGTIYELGQGKHLFPITLYANNLPNPIRYYVSVYWDGRSLADLSHAHFDIQLLDEKTGEKTVGGRP